MSDKGMLGIVTSTGILGLAGTVINKTTQSDWITILGVLATICSLLFAYQQMNLSMTALRDSRKKEQESFIDHKIETLEKNILIRIEDIVVEIEFVRDIGKKITETIIDYNYHKQSFGHEGTITELLANKERISALEAKISLLGAKN